LLVIALTFVSGSREYTVLGDYSYVLSVCVL